MSYLLMDAMGEQNKMTPTNLDNVKLHLVDDFETASNLMSWLGTRDADGTIGVDTETTGLVTGVDKVRLVQVGGREHGWAIPWVRWNGLFDEIVKKYQGRFIMHNAKFDYGMLTNQGETSVCIPTHRIDDTMVMSHILEPHMSKGLKQQAGRHVDSLAAGAQTLLDHAIGNRGGWSWETIPIDYGPYWQYAALDTVLTSHLYDHHKPLVDSIAPKSYQLELAVTWVIYAMERYGAHIDISYANEHHQKFLDYVETAGTWIESSYGVKPGSNAAIIKILQANGIEFDKRTASGAIALDKEVLGDIEHPLAQTVLNRRQYQKIARTYLRHFIDEVDRDDCIHPSINSLGARTGRMSMQNPNLQNLPRASERNKAANIVRKCITARTGNTLLMSDFSQVEMRLLAHMSHCTPMIEAFKSDGDFFVNLASQIFNDPNITKKDPRRQITKNAGYATIYGAGVTKFAKTAGVPVSEARAFFIRWNELYPEVKIFQDGVSNEAWDHQKTMGIPYVSSPLTGRRHVGDSNKVYALVNFLIQGTAAETFKTKLLQLAALGLDKYMVVPVHDEIILDVPKNEARDVVHQIQSVMNDDTMYDVPITATVAFGERWGNKQDWSEDAYLQFIKNGS